MIMEKFSNIKTLLIEDKSNTHKSTDSNEKDLNALNKKLEGINDIYIYVKATSKYYWVQKKIFFSSNEVCNNLNISLKELKTMRELQLIKVYDDIAYWYGWREGCYNLLDKNFILQPSDTPFSHPCINKLIDNVCWHKQENIEYLHKAILYKYYNINDVTLPAIVLYWKWWSWKGTLMSLLATIFWKCNVLANLWQRDLTSSFDTYRGQKLVVEFAEVTTNNTHSDMGILNKLKNIIWASSITINEKWVRQYQIDNIAWFFISSNSNRPLQLDDKDKGNRRFTVIKSDTALQDWKDINEVIRDKNIVADYLALLHHKYPEVLEWNNLEALDNQDKRDLEERSQHEANQFWDRVHSNFPDYSWKKTKKDIENHMINMFCTDNQIDEKEFLKYFWNNSKYPKKKIRMWDQTFMWVVIPEIH